LQIQNSREKLHSIAGFPISYKKGISQIFPNLLYLQTNLNVFLAGYGAQMHKHVTQEGGWDTGVGRFCYI
jgi:hypothetical protein